MNQRIRLIVVIAVIALVAVVLAMVLARCGVQSTLWTETPGTPVPTFIKEEELVATMQHYSSQSATSPDECATILLTEPWCSVTKSAEQITFPEWEVLFPRTEFYLLRRHVYGQGGGHQSNLLITELEGKRYTPKTFDRLLKANGVTEITDENRELVAKAFALMTIPDYLEEEVLFTEWGETDWPTGAGESYNWHLFGWTKIQGLKIRWLFIFEDGQLWATDGGIPEQNTGDYIDVPFERLPIPSRDDFRFSFRGN